MYILGFSINMPVCISMIINELLHYFFSFAGVLERIKSMGYIRRQIIIIDSASSPCIYISLYLETDNRRKYLLSFWESALADEIRADLITGNFNAR